MSLLLSLDNKFQYKAKYQQEFRFTPEEQAKFQHWHEVLDQYNLARLAGKKGQPAPDYNKNLEEWLRFCRWRTWQLSRKHPDLYPSLLEPVGAHTESLAST